MATSEQPKLVQFYCRYCKAAILQTFPEAQVWCAEGHKCSKTKPKGL